MGLVPATECVQHHIYTVDTISTINITNSTNITNSINITDSINSINTRFIELRYPYYTRDVSYDPHVKSTIASISSLDIRLPRKL